MELDSDLINLLLNLILKCDRQKRCTQQITHDYTGSSSVVINDLLGCMCNKSVRVSGGFLNDFYLVKGLLAMLSESEGGMSM